MQRESTSCVYCRLRSSCNVALLARTRDALEKLAGECAQHGVKAHVVTCDMSSKQSVEDACRQVGQVFANKVDILINNAGIFGERVSVMDEKTPSGKDVVDMWEEVIMVNMLNLMRITGRLVPMMKECKHGAIIAISSLAATVSVLDVTADCDEVVLDGQRQIIAVPREQVGRERLSRIDLRGYGIEATALVLDIDSLVDVREYGIKVCSIMPGFVNTPMLTTEGMDLHMDKCIQSEDIAEGVLYILRTPYNVCPTEIKYRPQYTPYKRN